MIQQFISKGKRKYWSQEIGTMTVPIKRSRAKYSEKQQQWIMKPLMIKTDRTHISIYILIYSTVSKVRTNLAEYTKQNSTQLMVSIKPESISTRPSFHNWKSKQKQTQKMQKMQNLVAVFSAKKQKVKKSHRNISQQLSNPWMGGGKPSLAKMLL